MVKNRQAAVQLKQFRTFVPNAAGPNREKQDILALKSELDGVQLRERSPEETCGDEQHERKHNLGGDKRVAKSEKPAPAWGVAGANFLERGRHVNSRGLKCRRQTKHQARQR